MLNVKPSDDPTIKIFYGAAESSKVIMKELSDESVVTGNINVDRALYLVLNRPVTAVLKIYICNMGVLPICNIYGW